MNVVGFAHDSATDSPVLVLRQDNGDSVLPIWIGQAEAYAIAMAANEESAPRPLAHNLLLQIVESLSGRISSFSIVNLQDGIFYGVLDILDERSGTLKTLDCRPSDGVAVALLAQVPILLDESVLIAAALRRRRNEPSGDFSAATSGAVIEEMLPAQAKDLMTEMSAGEGNAPGGKTQESTRLSELLQSLEPVSKRVM